MSTDTALKSLMDTNFIEYASYVIKDRAIPFLEDGLKPVQRRILYALFEMDDGKFHKVANVVGHTMRYHPHGDASIEAALVHMAQKGYLIDTQGNFGNPTTGDPASAARYIECRLSELAKRTLFNPEITSYIESYDGRHQEPVCLPAKLPVLLLSGTEGIAVGLSTKILPHNLIELLEAQIAILKEQPFEIYPDFFQKGIADVSQYQKGQGKIRLRAKIETTDRKTLSIREIPFGTTTETLIASIEKAIHRGKLKISSINDFTTDRVEIELKIGHGIQAEEMIPRLYLYSDCEVTIHTNAIVIANRKPIETDVHHILTENTRQLVSTLKQELHCELAKHQQRRFNQLLIRMFVEHKLYRHIEEADNYKQLKELLKIALCPLMEPLGRPIQDDDLEKLLSIPIKRLSKLDIEKSKSELRTTEKAIQQVEKHLENITRYTIQYLHQLIKQYQEFYPRQTTIETFDMVDVREVAVQDLKVGYDRKNNYLGLQIKQQNPLLCSSFDKLLLFFKNGTYQIIQIPDKLFLEDKLVYLDRQSSLKTISILYHDTIQQLVLMKRFVVNQFILDKVYRFIPEKARLLFFSSADAPIIKIEYTYVKRVRIQAEYVHLGRLRVKSVSAMGNQLSEKMIDRITLVNKQEAEPLFEANPEAIRLKYELTPAPASPTLFD